MELVNELSKFCRKSLAAFYRRVEEGNGWDNAESWALTRFYRSANKALTDAGGENNSELWMAGRSPKIEDIWPAVSELASLAGCGRLDALEALCKLAVQSGRMLIGLDRLAYVRESPLPTAADWKSKRFPQADPEQVEDSQVNSMLRELEEKIASDGPKGSQEEERI